TVATALGIVTRDAFDRNNFAPGHEREGHEATIDRAVTALAAHVAVDDRDRAGAAVAFRAAFLGSGQAVATQPFEQGRVGRNGIDPNRIAVETELDRGAHLLWGAQAASLQFAAACREPSLAV